MKKRLFFVITFLRFQFKAVACSVCLGDFTEKEIYAYSFSVILLITILFFIISFVYRKIKQNYDIY